MEGDNRARRRKFIGPPSPRLTNGRFRLAGVKKDVFNPGLPTLRQMERDDVMCRLADEHCRHTTHCSARQFQESANRPFRVPDEELHWFKMNAGNEKASQYNTMEELQIAHEVWRQSTQGLDKKALDDVQSLECDSTNRDDWHFDGVCLKVMKPEIRDWRYTLRCEPGLEPSCKSQHITPSNIMERHRATDPAYNHCHLAVCNRRW